MLLQFVPHLDVPGDQAPVARVAKGTAAMQGKIVQGEGHAIFAQIRGGGADDELHGEQAACDQPLLGRDADAQPHIDPLLHPVADPVIEPDIRLHIGIAAAVLLQQRPYDRLHHGARAHYSQRAGELLTGLARRRQGLLQAEQGRLRRLQKSLPLFGQRHAAGGAMKQAYPQIAFQLPERLAGGLGRDLLGLGRLAEAAQLGRVYEGGDGAQFVDHGLAHVFTSFGCN